MSGSSVPSLVLHLNMQNWDLLPPLAAYLSSDLRRPLSKDEILASEDPSEPVSHIAQGRDVAWPCSPGFLQYHVMYPKDSWQVMRRTYEGSITWIVVRACNMVDRERLGGPIV